MREYSSGDWFAVPVGAWRFVPVLVLRVAPRVAGVYVLGPDGIARWLGRVYDRPIRERRWVYLRKQSPFDENAWPTPNGEATDPRLVERAIAARLAGEAFVRPHRAVCDLRAPLDERRLAALPGDAVLQWRRPLSAGDLKIVANAIEANPRATVRLYGDAGCQIDDASRAIRNARWHLDVRALHWQRNAIEAATELTLDGGSSGLAGFPNLERLTIRPHGGIFDASVCTALPQLRSLVVSGASLVRAQALGSQERLNKLDLVDVTVDDPDQIFRLPHIEALRLKRVERVTSLATLEGHAHLRYLALEGLTHIDDLRPLANVPHLESLEIAGSWQFGVGDVASVVAIPQLERLRVDIGGLRKNAEIYARRPFAMPPLFETILTGG